MLEFAMRSNGFDKAFCKDYEVFSGVLFKVGVAYLPRK